MSSWADYYQGELSVSQVLGNLNAHAALFEAVLAESPHNVLEVGVGTGMMGVFLSQWGLRVSGLDNDREVLEHAAEVAERFRQNIEFIEGDAFDLRSSLGERQWDAVYSQGFFEHFDDEAIRDLVTQQLGVAPVVVFSVPGNGYPTRDFGNERLMAPKQWLRILEGVGEVEARAYGLEGRNPINGLRRRILRGALHVLVTVHRR